MVRWWLNQLLKGSTMLKSTLAAALIASTMVLSMTSSSTASPEDSPQGSWQECSWNGVRWNVPCAYDHKHSPTKGTESFVMYTKGGSVRTERVSHSLAHYLLGK